MNEKPKAKEFADQATVVSGTGGYQMKEASTLEFNPDVIEKAFNVNKNAFESRVLGRNNGGGSVMNVNGDSNSAVILAAAITLLGIFFLLSNR